MSNTDPILITYSTLAKNGQRTSTPTTGSEKKKKKERKIILIMISNLVVLGIETGNIRCNKYLHWPIESISQHMLSYLFLK